MFGDKGITSVFLKDQPPVLCKAPGGYLSKAKNICVKRVN